MERLSVFENINVVTVYGCLSSCQHRFRIIWVDEESPICRIFPESFLLISCQLCLLAQYLVLSYPIGLFALNFYSTALRSVLFCQVFLHGQTISNTSLLTPQTNYES
jgi:hypothetical protein